MNEDLKQYITNALYFAQYNKMVNVDFDMWVESQVNGLDEFIKSEKVTDETISDVEVMAYFNLHSHTMINIKGIQVPYFKRSDILEFAKWIRSKLTK